MTTFPTLVPEYIGVVNNLSKWTQWTGSMCYVSLRKLMRCEKGAHTFVYITWWWVGRGPGANWLKAKSSMAEGENERERKKREVRMIIHKHINHKLCMAYAVHFPRGSNDARYVICTIYTAPTNDHKPHHKQQHSTQQKGSISNRSLIWKMTWNHRHSPGGSEAVRSLAGLAESRPEGLCRHSAPECMETAESRGPSEVE